MDTIRVRGGHALDGTVRISGAKNAALPLMAASLLTDGTLALANLPRLADIETMASLLGQHGVGLHMREAPPDAAAGGRIVELTAARIASTTAPYDLVRRMRASILVLGPLVARCGEATVSLPGGCAIGSRPVDHHIGALQQLGAEVSVDGGYVRARAPGGLAGAAIDFPAVSVGATENLLMAATLARGETVLRNAAREPEIADLANCLVAMGARIGGIGSATLTVRGVARLHGAEHAVMPDRIEAGTYAIAAAITGGALDLRNARYDDIAALAGRLRAAGVAVEPQDGGVLVSRRGQDLGSVDVRTEPFPGFPTDLQAQFMALMTVAGGAATMVETVFDNRFMHVPELRRMGARIDLDGASAVVRGVKELAGAPVMASDLRASASLVLGGLAARGETEVRRVYHLDRGYERMEQKLAAVGADIERVGDAP